jgi:hypothetical protein
LCWRAPRTEIWLELIKENGWDYGREGLGKRPGENLVVLEVIATGAGRKKSDRKWRDFP